MKKILLICSAGMSTSLMVVKMQEEARRRDLTIQIWAVPVAEAEGQIDEADIIFLGPQVRFMQNQFAKNVSVPVEIIDMRAYGTMDGATVLDQALAILDVQ